MDYTGLSMLHELNIVSNWCFFLPRAPLGSNLNFGSTPFFYPTTANSTQLFNACFTVTHDEPY